MCTVSTSGLFHKALIFSIHICLPASLWLKSRCFCDALPNKLQIHLRQSFSSSPSGQSPEPSHFHSSNIHLPSLHRKSLSIHPACPECTEAEIGPAFGRSPGNIGESTEIKTHSLLCILQLSLLCFAVQIFNFDTFSLTGRPSARLWYSWWIPKPPSNIIYWLFTGLL